MEHYLYEQDWLIYKPSNISSVLWRNLWQEKVKIYIKEKTADGRDDIGYQIRPAQRPYTAPCTVNHTERFGKSFCRKTDRTAQSRKKSQLPDKMTLGEAAGLWLEENRSKWKESTYATYRSITEKHVLPLWGTQTADALLIDPPVSLPGLKEGEQKKYSGAYKHQIQIITSQIFHFLDKKYHCGVPQWLSPAAPAQNRTITPPEGDKLRRLEAYLSYKAEEKDATSIGILLSGCCGLRIGELCALQWKNINWEEGTIQIRGTMQRIRTFQQEDKKTKIIISDPKSRSSNREIPVPAYLLDYLKRLKGNREGYILAGKKKEYLEPRTLQYRFKKILEQLGIPYFNFHMLRHIFATNCISRGFDMKTLSELLGHSNITTTMRIYVHSDMERKNN